MLVCVSTGPQGIVGRVGAEAPEGERGNHFSSRCVRFFFIKSIWGGVVQRPSINVRSVLEQLLGTGVRLFFSGTGGATSATPGPEYAD